MTKKKVEVPQDKLDAYDRLIATNPKIERKGATMPYTSVNGHMFSILSKTGTLGLRLAKEDREDFLDKYATTLYESYGAIMKEYVAVPDALLQSTAELRPYLELSYDYALSLKPKTSAKKS